MTELNADRIQEQLDLFRRDLVTTAPGRRVYSMPSIDTYSRGFLCECFYMEYRARYGIERRNQCSICHGAGYRPVENVRPHEIYL